MKGGLLTTDYVKTKQKAFLTQNCILTLNIIG